MLIGEPAPTQADLHFRILGLPVRVHPFFWIAAVLLGFGGSSATKADPIDVLLWVAVVFVSILVHELGHAIMQRRFGGNPWITLYSFGGLASCNDCDRSPRSQITILLAGPFAGFLLAACLLVAIKVGGHNCGFATENQLRTTAFAHPLSVVGLVGNLYVYFESFQSEVANQLFRYLLFVNIAWGILNLLPIYPLDGGQIARELFTLRNPRTGVIQSLQLSIGAAILIAIYGLANNSFYMCLMFGYLAYASYQTLRAYRDHWR